MKPLLIFFVLLAGPTVLCACSKEVSVPIKEYQKLPDANTALFKEGWRPRETELKTADGELWRSVAMAGDLFKDGYRGVEICAGTGLSPCVFNYANEKGDCLRIITQGMYDKKAGDFPGVVSWSFKCPGKEFGGYQ